MDYLLTAYTPLARGAVLEDRTLREIGEVHGKAPAQVALRIFSILTSISQPLLFCSSVARPR